MTGVRNILNPTKSNNNSQKEQSLFKAIVVANFGNQIIVQDDNKLTYRCSPRPKIGQLVAGDKVFARRENFSEIDNLKATIIELLPAKNSITRQNSQKKLCPIAANIDYLVIIIALSPSPAEDLIARYVIASENHMITPLLVLNKVDLLEQNKETNHCVLDLIEVYEKLDYQTIYTSAKNRSVGNLEQIIVGKTSVLVGQSGVGKSSILNVLLSRQASAVAASCHDTDLGKHTTSAAHLFNLEAGGFIIDSPGISEFGLWNISDIEIASSFREFLPYLGSCRFRNCKHHVEPGCALRGAFDAGLISESRWNSFLRIKGHG